MERCYYAYFNLRLSLYADWSVSARVCFQGIVHLVGYTSESPDEQQVDEDPNESLPPQLMPPAHQDEDASLEEQQGKKWGVLVHLH